MPPISAAASLGSARAFPLPDTFFPPVTLTAAEIRRLEEQARRVVQEALVEYNVHESVGPLATLGPDWAALGRVGDLKAARKRDARTCHTRVSGSINADFRLFLDLFYAETAGELLEWNQYMFGHAVDAAVLRSVDTLASGKPHLYLGVKWVCLQPSALARKRDECFLEYMALTTDLRGRAVGVRVTLPLDLPECPALPAEMRVKRLRTRSVVIVRPLEEARQPKAQLFMLTDCDPGDHVGSSKYSRRLMERLRDAATFSDSKRLATHGLASRANWVPARSRRACAICARRFRPGRLRAHCRLCGDVFCSKCVVLRDAPAAAQGPGGGGPRRFFQTAKTKFCKMCVTRTRESDVSGVLAARTTALLTDAPATNANANVNVNVSVSVNAESNANANANTETETETSRISWWSETETGNWKEQTFRFSVASAGTSATAGSSDGRASPSTRRTLTLALALEADPRRSSTGSFDRLAGDFGHLLDSTIAISACSQPVAEGVEESDAAKPGRSSSFDEVDTAAMAPASLLDLPPTPADYHHHYRSRTRFVTTPVPPLCHMQPAPRGNCRLGHNASAWGRRGKSRSLSECLAEQEELLRMVMAASGGFHPTKTMPTRKPRARRPAGADELFEL